MDHNEKYDRGDYQTNYPNSHYLGGIKNPNNTNQAVELQRLPTLGEILAQKTKAPVDIFTYYDFMRDVEHKVDYLDFWYDLMYHLNKCKHYVQGLRESIIRQSAYTENFQPPNQVGEKNLRDSMPLLERSKHKSLSSSILLELIINDHILEENDSNRLSAFLRGDVNLENIDPKLKDLIEQYNNDYDDHTHKEKPSRYSPRIPESPVMEKRVSSNSRLLDDSSSSIVDNQLDIGHAERAVNASKYISLQSDPNNHEGSPFTTPNPNRYDDKRGSRINPSLLERLIKDSPGSATNSFINRDKLRESSHNLLLKYFVEDSEKNLDLPPRIAAHVRKCIEVDGRDDPDVFNDVKIYVFNQMERHHWPKFLNFVAVRNINHTNFFRIILGFFFLFVGFWIGYIFIFLNYRKALRAVIVVPFLVAFYCLISSLYLIDPLLAWFGFTERFSKDRGVNRYLNALANGSESRQRKRSFIKIRETFVRKFIIKRSLWVMFLILLSTAILTVIFCVVPGHRL